MDSNQNGDMAASGEKEKAKDASGVSKDADEAPKVEDAAEKAKDEILDNILHRTLCMVAKKAMVANPRTSRTATDAACAVQNGIESRIVQQSIDRWRMVVTEIGLLDIR